MTAQDLKNSILQLAVQGKLVPQDPNDEPASELLKRICAEKATLVKGGRLKKEKTLGYIKENEIAYELPDSWAWCRIGEAFIIVRGITFPANAKNTIYTSGLVSCATTGSVQDTYNYDADVFVSEQFVKRNDQWLLPNDIIMSTANSRELVGKTCIWTSNERKTFGGFLTVLRPGTGILPQYAYYALMSIKSSGAFLKTATQTTNIANINTTVLQNTLFPLPPLAEQKRIVAKIEELLPLIEGYGEAEERLKELNAEFPDKLRKSILQQAMQGKLTERDSDDEPASELLKRIRTEKAKLIAEGKIKKEKPLPPITDEEKPFDIPDTWEWVRLGELGETQTGTTPSTKNPAFFGNDIPFIKPADIYADHINYENEGLSFAGSEQGRIISKNSIMMVCIGGSIGKTYYNDRSVCCNQQINTITPIFCSVKYVWLAMSSNYFRCELQKEATGTATPIINKSLWSNIVIPLPPLAEQERIVARGEELLAVCDGLK